MNPAELHEAWDAATNHFRKQHNTKTISLYGMSPLETLRGIMIDAFLAGVEWAADKQKDPPTNALTSH